MFPSCFSPGHLQALGHLPLPWPEPSTELPLLISGSATYLWSIYWLPWDVAPRPHNTTVRWWQDTGKEAGAAWMNLGLEGSGLSGQQTKIVHTDGEVGVGASAFCVSPG